LSSVDEHVSDDLDCKMHFLFRVLVSVLLI